MDHRKSLTLVPSGPGTPRLLSDDIRADWAVFVEGGRQVLYGGIGADGAFRGYLQDTEGGAPRPWPGRLTPEAYCLVSPEGDRVALGPMNGRLIVCSLDGTVLKELPGLRATEVPTQWASRGDAIYLADLSSLPARIALLDLKTGRRRPWRELCPMDRTGVDQIKNLAISPDGSSLAYSFDRILTSDLYLTEPAN